MRVEAPLSIAVLLSKLCIGTILDHKPKLVPPPISDERLGVFNYWLRPAKKENTNPRNDLYTKGFWG